MRITVAGHAGSPDVDVEVPDDVRLGDLRPHLAVATGRPELAEGVEGAGGALAVDDVPLDDDQLTGQVPLVAGVTLRPGAGPADPERLALRSPWHLAVVAGPDSGALVPLDRPVHVGRGPGAGVGPGGRYLQVADPTVSDRHLVVTPGAARRAAAAPPARRAGRGGPTVQDLGSRHGTVLVRAGRVRPARVTTRRSRRLRPGDRLVAGATVLELRARGAPEVPGPVPARDPAPPASSPASAWVAGALGGVVFAVATGNPLMLALAAVGPATAAGASLARSVRRRGRRPVRGARRSRSTAGRPGAGGRTVPGALAAAPPPVDGMPWTGGLPCGADLRSQVLRSGPDAVDGRHPPAPDGTDRGPGGGPGGGTVTVTGRTAGAGHHPRGTTDPRTTTGPDGPGGPLRRLAPDGCLAVVGPRPAVLAVARLIVCAELTEAAAGAPADVRPEVWPRAGDADAWSWCRWLHPHEPGAPRPTLLLVDGVGGPVAGARTPGARPIDGGRSAAAARRRAGHPILVVEEEVRRVPAWCRTVLHLPDGPGPTTLTRADGTVVGLPTVGVSATWAERQARLLAAARHAAVGPPQPGAADGGTVPRTVALVDLPGIPPPHPGAVLQAWGRASTSGPPPVADAAQARAAAGAAGPRARTRDGERARGLVAALGTGPRGPVLVDLVRDGPHGLVAGTTGSGKSELLQTWVLSLALTYSPAELAVLLVDYKGGAGMGACTRLPHVVGQLTDLDPALAARALTGLRAELQRRERLLAGWSAPDLPSLCDRAPSVAPPRLLVVVDEFRALVDDLPGFVPALVRLAAQGRSLGVHLVLATQRPGGAVGPDLRANLAVRVALRVTDAADSLDVVDVPDAARIPAHLPGRALLRRGPAEPEPLQVAHADGHPAGGAAPVRRADTWADLLGAATVAGADGRPTREGHGAAGTTGMTEAWVTAATAAAGRAGLERPDVPWLPPLPASVDLSDLATLAAVGGRPQGTAGARGTGSGGGPGARDRRPGLPSAVPDPADPARASGAASAALPFALGDLPAAQRQQLVAWRPGDGALLVVGGPGSGRTTALCTLAVSALDRGWEVHTVAVGARLPASGHPGLGTCATLDDPRLVARLLTRLAEGEGDGDRSAATTPRLLLVDRLDVVLERLGTVARGRAADRLLDLVRDGRGRGVGVAAAAPATLGPSVAASFADRLVLPVGDTVAEAMAGVPTELVGGRRPPGRAVWLPAADGAAVSPPDVGGTGHRAVLCQVAVARGPVAVTAVPAAPLRLRPVPRVVGTRELGVTTASGAGRPTTVPVGLGGDDAGPVLVHLDRGALVVGPPGSGRSTALAVLTHGLLDAGLDVLVIARDGPVRDLGEHRTPSRTCGFDAREIARALTSTPTSTSTSPGGDGVPAVVVVDDLDAVEQSAPGTAAMLADLMAGDAAAARPGSPLTSPPASSRRRVPVLGSAQTAAACVAYRGPLASLRAGRRGIVLGAGDPGSSEIFGVDVFWDTDPARAHEPGLGVVVHGHLTTPVRVARLDAARPDGVG